jgi:flagellar protein FlgJ
MTTPIQTTPGIAAASVTASTAANTYTDPTGLAALKNAPQSPQTMKAVAQQVEALFLQMMLKSMRDASTDMGQPASNEMGMYQDMFDKQIALTMSQHQDMGLGAMLTRQLNGGSATATAPLQPSAAPAIGAGPAAGQASVSSDESALQFVGEVLPTITRAAASLGLSPLGMLAQTALETGWGKRMVRGADGKPSLNLFGIKAGDGWDGSRAMANTVEYSGGVATQRRAAFRAYDSIEASVGDFVNLLRKSPHYRDAVAAGNDVNAYIASIGKSGYATDPHYANKLSEIVNSSTFRTAVAVVTKKL